jgi:Leucine-rich repeat (LRR) protein
LEQLDLSDNALVSIASARLCHNLVSLRIDRNPLVTLATDGDDGDDGVAGLDFAALTRLTTLSAKDCAITDLPPSVGSLTALQWLDLNGNQLTDVPAELGCTPMQKVGSECSCDVFLCFSLGSECSCDVLLCCSFAPGTKLTLDDSPTPFLKKHYST